MQVAYQQEAKEIESLLAEQVVKNYMEAERLEIRESTLPLYR